MPHEATAEVDAAIAADLEKLGADPTPAGEDLTPYKPAQAPPAPKPTPTPAATAPVKDQPAPAPKPAEPPPKAPIQPAAPRKESVNAELRHKAEAAEKRVVELEEAGRLTAKQAEELRSKLESIEPQARMAEVLKQEVEAKAKVAQELEERIKRIDYTQSQEFHESFVKPVAKALEAAYSDVSEMVVESDGSSRQATKDDFKAILAMPLTQATHAAKAMFGDLASEVLAHRRQVLQAQRAQSEAVSEAGRRAEEFARRQAESAKQLQERNQRLYREHLGALESKYKDLYTAEETDKEAFEALQQGRRMADAAIYPQQGATPDQIIPTIAEVRQRAAAFPLMLVQNKRLQTKLAELEGKLKAYEESAPKGGTSGAGGATEVKPDTNDPWKASFERLQQLANQPG